MTAFSIETRNGVRRLILDLPGDPVNKLSTSVGNELDALLTEAQRDSDVRAIVLRSGKPDNFVAGADIDEFVSLSTREDALQLVRGGQTLINRFEASPKPVVAAIHGACAGGGLELALACAYRIATEHARTQLGLPEVKIGILPAAGGCQRLPRLIGAQAALDIILQGKLVPAKKAHRLGLVDELVHPAVLDRVAEDAALRLSSGWRPKRRHGGLAGAVLGRNPIGRKILFGKAEKLVRKQTGGHYPGPLAALDAVRHGLSRGVAAGLEREADHFAELALGEVSRNLVQIFFASTALKKDPGVEGDAPSPVPVSNLGVVGAGFMGSGIGATAVLKAQVDVRYRDADLGRVQAGLVATRKILGTQLKRRRITRHDHRRLSALVSGGTDWAGYRRADVVIEAVYEDLDVKRRVFEDLEAHTREDCVLASNTSTIPIQQIAEAVSTPHRVLGMHFFSPVEKMPLLEVIVTDQTAGWATVTALAFGRRMGKTCIVVRDRPGFWVNRILSPYMNEAGRLVQEGVRIEDVDRAMKRFGFPVGPITLLDEVGIDVAHKAGGVMYGAFGERMAPNDIVATMVDAQRLGRKNGKGFYQYEKGRRSGVDPAVYDLLHIDARQVPDGDVEHRLVYSMLNESARALEEAVVRSPRDGDMGAIFGIGYPPFRGGPLRYLDAVGIDRAVDTLRRLRDAYGDRFEPAPLLVEMAAAKQRFYPAD